MRHFSLAIYGLLVSSFALGGLSAQAKLDSNASPHRAFYEGQFAPEIAILDSHDMGQFTSDKYRQFTYVAPGMYLFSRGAIEMDPASRTRLATFKAFFELSKPEPAGKWILAIDQTVNPATALVAVQHGQFQLSHAVVMQDDWVYAESRGNSQYGGLVSCTGKAVLEVVYLDELRSAHLTPVDPMTFIGKTLRNQNKMCWPADRFGGGFPGGGK